MHNSEVFQIEVDRHSVAYREAGKGPALVLLHGFLCDSRCWRHQLSKLSDQFRIVAWDALGAGSSSDPPDPFMISDWTHCLAKFLKLLGAWHSADRPEVLAGPHLEVSEQVPAPYLSYRLSRTRVGDRKVYSMGLVGAMCRSTTLR